METTSTPTFRHEARSYASDDVLVATAGAFLRAGLEADERLVLAADGHERDIVLQALGDAAHDVVVRAATTPTPSTPWRPSEACSPRRPGGASAPGW